jgi:hypothetical protein
VWRRLGERHHTAARCSSGETTVSAPEGARTSPWGGHRHRDACRQERSHHIGGLGAGRVSDWYFTAGESVPA